MPLSDGTWTNYTTTEALEAIEDIFVNTFGSSVNLAPTTINGVFIQELTDNLLTNDQSQGLLFSQVYNPNLATGVFLDGICALNGISRIAATYSFTTCQLTGRANLVIPALSSILNQDNVVFQNANIITLDAYGVGEGIFTAIVLGVSDVSVNSLNRIVTTINGWDTINNEAEGTYGTLAQTDTQLRYTRQYVLGVNSTGWLVAMTSALQQTTGVLDLYIAENPTSSPATIQGVTVEAYGCYISVYGNNIVTDSSLSLAIANVIANKKNGGCAMTLDSSLPSGQQITQEVTNATYNWVTFTALFNVPTPTAIQMNINIVANATYPSTLSDSIKDGMVASFYGTDGSVPVQMGVPFYSSKFYSVLNTLGVYQTISLTIQIGSGGIPETSITLPINEVATLDISDVIIIFT